VRPGPRLGVDVGKARVGLARCDREGLLATPVDTLDRATALLDIQMVAADMELLEVVVGLPLALSGQETASTQDAKKFAADLVATLTTPVRMVDERLSTVQASQSLRQAGRSSKKQRAVIDQVAAVILLQHALDAERYQGIPPGHLVQPEEMTYGQ
jgi:putative Holliday junction resolvase